MTQRQIRREIEKLEERLDYNFMRMGVSSSRSLSKSPMVQRNLIEIIGASFVGGVTLGVLTSFLRVKSPPPANRNVVVEDADAISAKSGPPGYSIAVEKERGARL